MSRFQSVALWVATVSLAVLAVFSVLNYFDNSAHRDAELARQQADVWRCVQTVAALRQIPGLQFPEIPDVVTDVGSFLTGVVDGMYLDCLDR